ncbi:MAG: hypothetical protein IPQ03_05180 [Bacteroidetes bacterium]|nr:hypothetical protein [Bacteroidota bacterium]
MIKIVRNSCPHVIRKPLSGKLILLSLLVLMQSVSFGQTTKKLKAPTLTRIEFLFDASQSMYGQWQSGAKIDIAKSLMKKVLDSLRYVDNLELALRVYGHRNLIRLRIAMTVVWKCRFQKEIFPRFRKY